MRQTTRACLLSTLALVASPAAGQFDPAIFGSVVTTPVAQGGAVGACCLPDLSCELLTEFECGQIGGSFQGEFTDCASTNCVSLEACCFLNGVCTMETPNRCLALGGITQGPGSDCATANYPR